MNHGTKIFNVLLLMFWRDWCLFCWKLWRIIVLKKKNIIIMIIRASDLPIRRNSERRSSLDVDVNARRPRVSFLLFVYRVCRTRTVRTDFTTTTPYQKDRQSPNFSSFGFVEPSIPQKTQKITTGTIS
jgi:hypothetical protein